MPDDGHLDGLTLLGKKVRGPIKQLECFPKPEHVSYVCLDTEEFTSLCPMTGQPDFMTVSIEYRPSRLCLESKSLKLYLWTFREQGTFIEQLVETILDDVWGVLEPKWCKVRARMRPRGGIAITAEAERTA